MKINTIIFSILFTITLAISCKKKDSQANKSSSTTGSTTSAPNITFEQVLIGSGASNWKSSTLCGYPPCFSTIPPEPCFTFNTNHSYLTPSYNSVSGSCSFSNYNTYTWQIINDNGISAQLVSSGAGSTGTITISSYSSNQFVTASGCTYVKQ